MPRAEGRNRRIAWVWISALLLFMIGVVWLSLQETGVRCEVCITFHGRAQCRAADAASREEAMSAATTNACAYLASGVTDGMACSRTAPDRAECRGDTGQ